VVNPLAARGVPLRLGEPDRPSANRTGANGANRTRSRKSNGVRRRTRQPEEMIVEWGAEADEADEADEAWESDEGYDEADDSVERPRRKDGPAPAAALRPRSAAAANTKAGMLPAAGARNEAARCLRPGRAMSPSRRPSPRPPRPIAASPPGGGATRPGRAPSTAWRHGAARSRRTPARFSGIVTCAGRRAHRLQPVQGQPGQGQAVRCQKWSDENTAENGNAHVGGTARDQQGRRCWSTVATTAAA